LASYVCGGKTGNRIKYSGESVLPDAVVSALDLKSVDTRFDPVFTKLFRIRIKIRLK